MEEETGKLTLTLMKRKTVQIKSSLSLYSLDYAKACNELAGPISASLRPGNTAPFEEKLQRWRAVGNTVSDLTGPRFEPQTSHSRDERVTARSNFISRAHFFQVFRLVSISVEGRAWSARSPGPKLKRLATLVMIFFF